MTAWLLSEFGPWLMAGAAALVALLVAWLKGRGSVKAKIKQAEAYAETRKRIDDEATVGNDPAAARRWLRERDDNQR
jgi:hypothetical protein